VEAAEETPPASQYASISVTVPEILKLNTRNGIKYAPLNTGGEGTVNSGTKQEEQYLCDTCGKPLTYIAAYNAWYCYPCQKYAPPRPGQQYKYPEGYQAGSGQYPVTGADEKQPAGYSRQAFGTGYESYGSGAAAKAEGKPTPGKCPKCGAPIPASGECANCRSKELLSEADRKMEEATASGVDVRKVDLLVRQARNSLDEGNFGESKLTADKALQLLEETVGHFTKAKEQIVEAQHVVDEHRGHSVDVGQSDSLIQLAQSFLKTGNYEKAVAYAKKAIKTANEAQTRQVTEKALVEKPPLPPAVAKPVDPGPVTDARAAISRPVILGSAGASPAPGGPAVCPACGEAVEPAWKRCPSCTSTLTGATESAVAPPSRAAERPAAPRAVGPEPTAGAAEGDAAAAELEIRDVEAELEKLEKAGQNVAHARNLLKLAISFLRGGSYEKATRYARKVKNVLEEKKSG